LWTWKFVCFIDSQLSVLLLSASQFRIGKFSAQIEAENLIFVEGADGTSGQILQVSRPGRENIYFNRELFDILSSH
jgi:hypothetical protein